MKILSIGEFDPCGVTREHRDALRARGFDYRMVVIDVYTNRQLDADWIWGRKGDPWEMLSFAREADVLQFYPIIGQPWSCHSDHIHLLNADAEPWPESGAFPRTLWNTVNPGAVRVYYLHGSANLMANLPIYKKRYEGKTVWASTIDYAHLFDATYAPPICSPVFDSAVLRGDNDPLIAIHAPTDLSVCNTKEFLDACGRLGIVCVLCHQLPHETVMLRKAVANVGFDHLRGCFSVNTLENAALGLVPLVGINHEWIHVMGELPLPPGPYVCDETTMVQALEFLRDHPDATRTFQMDAHHWYHHEWRPRVIDRLVKLYETL